MTKIFICWSGRRSQAFALILKKWLQRLMPRRIDARLSVDIQKGTLWFQELDAALDGAELGIICLTEEALRSPWIHYEAGILSRALRETTRAHADAADGPQVFPVLFGLEGARLSGPLAAYQSTAATSRDDMWRFVQAVASRTEISPGRVRERFDAQWRRLLAELDTVSAAPIHEVFPDIDDLFNGKAFDEPLDQQLVQNWLERYDEVRRTHWRLREKVGAVKAACRTFTFDLFNELTAEVDAYARDLSLLLGHKRNRIGEDGRVVLEQRGIANACEKRRDRVIDLAAQLVDPRQAAVFDDAFRFAIARTTAARKRLVHREAARLRARPPALAPRDKARKGWLTSDWDLDHILFYELQRDRPLKSFPLSEVVRSAAVEFERVRFRPAKGTSLMALYYSLDGLRRLLRTQPKRTTRHAHADTKLLIDEVLAFLNRPGRGDNAPILSALRESAELLGLTALKQKIVRSAEVDEEDPGRRSPREPHRDTRPRTVKPRRASKR